jgi:hypothetical protein
MEILAMALNSQLCPIPLNIQQAPRVSPLAPPCRLP